MDDHVQNEKTRVAAISVFASAGMAVAKLVVGIVIGYSVTTILPRCLLASMCSNALPISANG